MKWVTYQRQIQDLPEGLRQPQGAPTYYLTNFFRKTAWKWKKFGPEGGGTSLAPPLDPLLLICKHRSMFQETIIGYTLNHLHKVQLQHLL